jgi:hypothetical protein
VKCGATTRLSSRVSDRPTKLSQVLEMGELRWKLAALAAGDEWALAGHHAFECTGCAGPPSATDVLKALLQQHNSHADKQGRNTPVSHFHGSMWWDRVLYATLAGKTAVPLVVSQR